jgi:hypothetical protein
MGQILHLKENSNQLKSSASPREAVLVPLIYYFHLLNPKIKDYLLVDVVIAINPETPVYIQMRKTSTYIWENTNTEITTTDSLRFYFIY